MEDKSKTIKLIVTEIDGVLTDGTYAEDEMGHVLYKRFNTRDFSAINELKKNFKVVFLSDDPHINYNMARRKNIPFYLARNEEEKYNKLIEVMHRYGRTPDETVYIGSKISDRKCIQLIPKSFCPDDVGHFLKNICWAHFTTGGSTGIMMELLHLLKTELKNGRILE